MANGAGAVSYTYIRYRLSHRKIFMNGRRLGDERMKLSEDKKDLWEIKDV